MLAIGKSKAKVYVETDTKTKFTDVAGVDEAKAELQEVVTLRVVLARPDAVGLLARPARPDGRAVVHQPLARAVQPLVRSPGGGLQAAHRLGADLPLVDGGAGDGGVRGLDRPPCVRDRRRLVLPPCRMYPSSAFTPKVLNTKKLNPHLSQTT